MTRNRWRPGWTGQVEDPQGGAKPLWIQRVAAGLSALVIAATVGFGGAALAADEAAKAPVLAENFVTSTGHELSLPPIRTLSCEQMKRLLQRIDSTNYRGVNPEPADLADMPLFVYENQLAAAHYQTCSNRRFPSPQSSGGGGGAFRFSTSN